MATFLDLSSQQQVNDRAIALEWLVNDTEKLIQLFDWQAPNEYPFSHKVSQYSYTSIGVAPRRINEGFRTAKLGKTTYNYFPIQEYGVVDTVDPDILQAEPNRTEEVSIAAAREIGVKWANRLFDPNATGASDESMVGLPYYCDTFNRVMELAPDGRALSLLDLNRAIRECRQVTNNAFFLVPDAMFNWFSQLKNTQTISGNIAMTQDDLGRPITTFAGIPLISTGRTIDNIDRQTFNEDQGINENTTSIYLVYTGLMGVYGLRSPLTDTIDSSQYLQLTNGTYAPVVIHGVHQKLGIAINNPYSVLRIKGITDEAITAT